MMHRMVFIATIDRFQKINLLFLGAISTVISTISNHIIVCYPSLQDFQVILKRVNASELLGNLEEMFLVNICIVQILATQL